MRFLKYIWIILIVFSCKNNSAIKPEKPDNLIPEDKMVNVLYDMALISAAKGANKKLLENNGIFPETYIYTKHGIDSLQFAKSNAYYAHDLDTYEDMYARVKSRLEKDKQQYTIQAEADKERRDSIAKSRRSRQDSVNRNRPLNLKSDTLRGRTRVISPLKTTDSSKISTRQ